MGILLHLAVKDLRLLWRDKLGLFWVVGFPLIMALFFGSIYGGGGGDTAAMPIAVVDEDLSAGSRLFTSKLEASDALEVQSLNLETAKTGVRKGNLVAFVHLEKGFGDSFALFGGENAPFEVGIDPARRAESGYLQGVLMQASFETLQGRFADPAAMRAKVQSGIANLSKEDATSPPDPQRDVLKGFLGSLDQFLGSVDTDTYKQGLSFGGASGGVRTVSVAREETEPKSAFEISFPAAVTWGLLGCTAAFALSLVRERLSGTLLRLRLAPLSHAQVLAGKGLACFITCASATSLMLLLGHLMFHVRVPSVPLLALAVASSAWCFVGIMMLLSTAGRTIHAVSGIGWGCFVVMEMLGGGMVPLINMPKWMLTLSHFSPVKWAILSMEGAIWRGFSLTEMLLPCGILVGVGAITFALGVIVMSRSKA